MPKTIADVLAMAAKVQAVDLRFTDLPGVWQQDWVVHCLSVGNRVPALKYLAPYVFQVATPALAAAPQRAVIRCPKCQQPMAVVATLRPTTRCPPPAARSRELNRSRRLTMPDAAT